MTMADLLPQLTLAEKAGLVLGSTMWHTAPVARLGIPAAMLSDGPHGLRRQPDGNHAGISGSLPATCFPTALLVYDPGYALPEDIPGEVVNRRIDTDWYYRWEDWN